MPEDPRDTRERLLDAAEALFADHGRDAVSVRDIAAAAEVNLAAVNYHFQGKDNLYLEVVRRAVAAKSARHRAGIRATVDDHGHDLGAAIRSFFRTHLEDVLKSPEGIHFLKLFVREMHHGSSDVAAVIQDELKLMWDDLVQAILASQPGADPAVAQWIVGSLHGQLIHFTMRWHKNRIDRDRDDIPEAMRLLFPPLADDVDVYIDRAVDHITRFSVAGIQAVIAGAQPGKVDS
jgi:AcrR family transcriptional regulator